MRREKEKKATRSEGLDIDLETTLGATLDCCSAPVRRRNLFKLVLVFRLLPPVPDVGPRLFPQFRQLFRKLFALLVLLLGFAPLEFGVERFGRSPLGVGEGKGFDLTPEEEHHVAVRRAVRIRAEEVRHEFRVAEFGCGPDFTTCYQ